MLIVDALINDVLLVNVNVPFIWMRRECEACLSNYNSLTMETVGEFCTHFPFQLIHGSVEFLE